MIAIPKFSAYRGTAIAATILGLLLSQRHAGFMIFIVWLILFPWLVVRIFLAYIKPEQRPLIITRASLWIVMSIIVLSSHAYMHFRARANAQVIVDSILAYEMKNGNYPDSLEAIGIDNKQMRSALGLSGYFYKEGKASFFYASTYVPFMVEQYDFAEKRWTQTD